MVLAPQVKHLVFGKGWYEQTLTGAWTVDLGVGLMQEADPGGASRAATLPSAATWENVAFFCKNSADADETITFDDEDATVIGRGETCILISDGSAWKRFGIFSGTGSDPLTNISTVAAAGADQSGATAITSRVANVTGADGAKGVKLPAAAAGLQCIVYNADTTNALLVYPASGDDINDDTADLPVTVPPKRVAVFVVALDTATWCYADFVDMRSAQTIAGAKTLTGGLTLTTAGLTITDVNIVGSTNTGTKIGTATGQKFGFFNATPVIQPAAAGQADQGAMTGVALDPAALNDGSADNTMIGAFDLTDYTKHASGGTTVTSNAATDLDTTATALELFRDEQAGFNDSIEKNFDKLTDEINANRVDIAALDTLLTEVRTALVNLGLMKGSA